MWGTLDDLYTRDLYSVIVYRIASKLALCFVTLFSYQHTKSEQKYTLVNLRLETPHLTKINHVSNSGHIPNGRLKKNF